MQRSIESVKEAMDETGRKITKIAREVSKFTVQAMKEEGICTAEVDFIHLIWIKSNSAVPIPSSFIA